MDVDGRLEVLDVPQPKAITGILQEAFIAAGRGWKNGTTPYGSTIQWSPPVRSGASPRSPRTRSPSPPAALSPDRNTPPGTATAPRPPRLPAHPTPGDGSASAAAPRPGRSPPAALSEGPGGDRRVRGRRGTCFLTQHFDGMKYYGYR